MAFSGMINVKSRQLTLGGQFEAYKRGQLERKIHMWAASRAEKAAEYILGNEQIILDEEEVQVPDLAEEVAPF